MNKLLLSTLIMLMLSTVNLVAQNKKHLVS